MSGNQLSIKVKVDTRSTLKALTRMRIKQIPFATARALTRTAKGAATESGKKTDKYFDRPTPFTRRAFGIIPAKKTKLQAFVFVKDHQVKYLQYQIFGGTRIPNRKAIGVPTKNQRLNKYGNMPRGKIKKLIADKNTFSGTPRGGDRPAGIWKRTNRNKRIKLLVAWEPKARYRRRFPFQRIIHKYATAHFTENYRKSLADALRTAK